MTYHSVRLELDCAEEALRDESGSWFLPELWHSLTHLQVIVRLDCSGGGELSTFFFVRFESSTIRLMKRTDW